MEDRVDSFTTAEQLAIFIFLAVPIFTALLFVGIAALTVGLGKVVSFFRSPEGAGLCYASAPLWLAIAATGLLWGVQTVATASVFYCIGVALGIRAENGRCRDSRRR